MEKIKSKLSIYLIWGVILALSFTLVKNVIRAKQIQDQIISEKKKITKIQEDNDRLASEIARTQSASFIEREMRDKLGLGMNGEAVVVLPDEETLRKLAPIIPVEVDTLPDPNWKKWAKLFL